MQPCRGIAMQRDAAGRVSSQARTCFQTSMLKIDTAYNIYISKVWPLLYLIVYSFSNKSSFLR
jgi:hypothetical protein